MSIDSINFKPHSLIDEEFYREQYKRIKNGVGAKLVEKWTESTDAKRYVFEDCGILAYILSIKREISLDFNYFVDLGCGNGLLAHLLTIEGGFKGFGFDARVRKIWEKFVEGGTDLRKFSLDPSDVNCKNIPDNVDFMIGNHTDELTPWIPILAARRNCQFFLLPCCFYDFYHKFNNKPTNKNKGGIGISRYDQYLNYVKSIGESLGYRMQVDKLKTSSDKRVCFIGTIPPEGLAPNREEIIAKLLADSITTPITSFTPIGDTVDSRNCTKIPFDYRQNLSKKLAIVLIESSGDEINGWKCGGKVQLYEMSKHLNEEDKAYMKSQFGGLQTFFKNFGQAFIIRRGEVQLRRWPEDYPNFCRLPEKFKKAYCWFFNNHPQGCPIEDKVCPFIHEPFPEKYAKKPKLDPSFPAKIQTSN